MRNSNAKKEKEKLIKYSQAEHFNKLKCQVNFGFCANPKFTLQKNFNTAIRMPLSSCYAQPTNLAFHNLCQSTKLPIGSRQLLGLNLKFCLASSHINSNINQTMLKMARSIRTLLTTIATTKNRYTYRIDNGTPRQLPYKWKKNFQLLKSYLKLNKKNYNVNTGIKILSTLRPYNKRFLINYVKTKILL